ncbi:MAG: OadG family protein [Elusimicrobia bacterium]|nr:OadG family protein [Elusimicrobiota bacterium]MDD7502291.1 OadG family protein [Elusimicrobiota bacterium]MDY5728681.1 OadG family protein [Elusimicrobiaceae bacterium]
MSADNLLMQSVNITIIGMLVVFVFLTLLVGIMKALAKLVQVLEKFFPQDSGAEDNALLAVAIAAAKRFQGN